MTGTTGLRAAVTGLIAALRADGKLATLLR